MSLSFPELKTPRSVAFCSIALSSLLLSSSMPCTATEPASISTTSANNATSRAPKAIAQSNATAKASAKRDKGLIAHLQPSAQAADSQIDSDDKNSKKESKAIRDNSDKDASSDEETGRQNNVYARQYFDKVRESRKRKYAHASSTVQIYAPEPIVWKVLIDFEQYPQIFKRMDTCQITKREHGLLFAETYLKPQMFVKKLCQHTVTDISQGPHFLQWKMLDGNFSSVYGSWTLSQGQDKKGSPVCTATYTLEADPGPVIPGPMVSFVLHQLEHEVVSAFKKACEITADEKPVKVDKADETAKKAVKK